MNQLLRLIAVAGRLLNKAPSFPLMRRQFLGSFGPDSEFTWIRWEQDWDGHLINCSVLARPRQDEATTRLAVHMAMRTMIEWCAIWQRAFDPEDRIQFIVGWPTDIRTTGRQIVKYWAIAGQLAELSAKLKDASQHAHEFDPGFRPGWAKGISFWC
jgi:hypothetical protein